MARKRPFKMAFFSPASRNAKLSELLDQCVRIPNSSASVRFLAVLIEDAGEALMREDLLWGDGAGDSKLPAPLMLGCRLCRPSAWYFYSDRSDGDVFFSKQRPRNSRRCRNRVLCAHASFDGILGLDRSGNVMFRRFVYLASVWGDQYREEELRTA